MSYRTGQARYSLTSIAAAPRPLSYDVGEARVSYGGLTTGVRQKTVVRPVVNRVPGLTSMRTEARERLINCTALVLLIIKYQVRHCVRMYVGVARW